MQFVKYDPLTITEMIVPHIYNVFSFLTSLIKIPQIVLMKKALTCSPLIKVITQMVKVIKQMKRLWTEKGHSKKLSRILLSNCCNGNANISTWRFDITEMLFIIKFVDFWLGEWFLFVN